MDIDQVICPKCNGRKYLAYKENKQYKSRLLCHRCNGNGTIEWLEVVFNRQRLIFDNWEIYGRSDN